MKITTLKILLAIPLFTILLGSCKKDESKTDETETIECPYTDEMADYDNTGLIQDGLIPLSINNYWVYADSVWDEDDNLISSGIDTLRPTGTRKTGEDIWWSFNNMRDILVKNDSAFLLASPDLGIGCKHPELLYYPIEADTAIDWIFPYGYGESRKTYTVGSPIITPAGEFSDCHFYSLRDQSGEFFEILKPNMGFVKYKIPSGDNYLEKTLIDYYIEE